MPDFAGNGRFGGRLQKMLFFAPWIRCLTSLKKLLCCKKFDGLKTVKIKSKGVFFV